MEKQNELIERIRKMEARLDKLEEGSLVENSIQEAEIMNVGSLSYRGKYKSPDGKIKSTFASNVMVSGILKINSKSLAMIIDAFSSEERVDIVKLLLKKALTAKEIMEILNFPTTGKVYHHLSFLEKLGIIEKNNEKFLVKEKCVEHIILMMLGASQILKNKGENNHE